MLVNDFDFELPPELIAQVPLTNRQHSRLLAVNRSAATINDLAFTDFPNLLNKNDLIVLNNTKVIPARLTGKSETGAAIETFLVEELSAGIWLVLAKPAKRLPPGKRIIFSNQLSATVLEKTNEGKLILQYEFAGNFDDIVQEIGKTPLPPYIKRAQSSIDSDRERYQTVYAKQSGAIAAPTAGLHFTPQILEQIAAAGTTIAEVTLHVGYGTFEPVRVDDVSEHRVAGERYAIDAENADKLNQALTDKKRIIAVGTTTTRTLESAVGKHGKFIAEKNIAEITITPGYKFKAIDALLTNFHLPASSLLVLVSTFAGHDLVLDAYRHAVAQKYRFFSYGDCMFIE